MRDIFHVLLPVVKALSELEFPSDPKQEDYEAVADILRLHSVTVPDFMMLDSKPGLWGNRGEWHWKLRCFRNSKAVPLKEVLA